MSEDKAQPPRVLVVDDEPSFTSAIVDTLENLGEGYVVDTADNGQVAWDKLQNVVYELVITDLRMPKVNGLELMERMRSKGIQTRLILMTAYGSEDVKARAQSLKVDHYMSKPIDIDELIDATREVLNATSEQRALFKENLHKRIESVSAKMDRLRSEVSAHCIILANAEGQLITYSGSIDEFDIPIMTALMAAGHASFHELARCMTDTCAFNLMYNEGAEWNTFSTSVSTDSFLMIVFERDSAQTPIGMVWLSTKRMISELLEVMTDADVSQDVQDLNSGFKASLKEEINKALKDELAQEGTELPNLTTDQQLISYAEAREHGIVSTNLLNPEILPSTSE